MRKRLFLVLFSLPALRLILPTGAYAVCPACTVAVGAGLGLSRWLGIDDAISGVWLGAFVLSSSLWLSNWLQKRYQLKSRFKYLDFAAAAAMYLFTLGPLAWTGVIGHPVNTLLGIDKLVFGTVVGSIVFGLSVFADKKVRGVYGKQLFNYQRVVFPVGLLAIISTVFYFLTK